MNFYDAPVREVPPVKQKNPINNPTKVSEMFRRKLGKEKKEYFIGLYLDARGGLIHKEIISMGTLTQSLVHPRECFYPAIKYSAVSIIVLHNHPSGDPSPSTEDIRTTERLKDAGTLLGIPLLDHVVVAKDGFYSFKEKGLVL